MAAKQVQKAVNKSTRGDIEQKGKKTRNNKRTSIGKSKNSHDNSKTASRERKGR